MERLNELLAIAEARYGGPECRELHDSQMLELCGLVRQLVASHAGLFDHEKASRN